ncbi:MAG: cyclic nucleotide-binding domain-containing protein [Anaerolineae bacterium]|nr:cyclic nucleotide-binding domain-containing protein [Anaerolineae bacterium]
MTSKLDFLKNHPLFKKIDLEDLAELAALVQEYEYRDGTVVAYQRDAADSLFMLKSGRLYAKTVERGIVTHSRHYLPGDYFGVEWLFAPSVQPATIQARAHDDRPVRLLVLRSRDFLPFLSVNHDVIDDLEPVYDATDTQVAGFPEEQYAEALKMKAKRDRRSNTMKILPDELIEFLARRSGWYLFVRLIPVFLGLLLVMVLPFAFLTSQPPGSFLYNMQFWCPGVLSLFFVVWGLFRLFDWTNDYFIVTNRRVIHREFNLRAFRVDIKIARIDQIQSVTVLKPSLIANLFNFGTVKLTTASQYGVILFDNIGQPKQVSQILERLTKRVSTLDSSREQTLVRQSIETYFGFTQSYELVGEEVDSTAVSESDNPGCLGSIMNRYRWRIEEDGMIIYHKHFLVALAAMAWPLLIGGVITVLGYLAVRFDLVTWQLGGGVLSPIYFLLFLWLVWDLEDWRNDLYQLDGRFIVDIDRTPFGFGESRKQAQLQNIQNVKAYTPGLIHTIFNYGFVEVETAGVDSNIVFEHVPFPGVVQSDIFQQIEELKQRQREAEETRRHKSFAVLLDVYKQEEEQGRMPRRTPPPLSWEDEGEEGD